MLTLSIENKKFQVPDRLEELSERQFLSVLSYLFGEPTPHGRSRVAAALLPVECAGSLARMTPYQIYDVVNAVTAWMGKTSLGCPFKTFRVGLTRYYLPRYQRMSVVESAKAQEYLEAYRNTRKEEYLNLMVATLCRPKRHWLRWAAWLRWFKPKWDGDIRILYNAQLVSEEAKNVAKLPYNKKAAVVYYFSQMMGTLQDQFRPVFAFRSENSKPAPLMDMIMHMAGPELGDHVKVSHTPIATLMYLLRCRLP